MKVWQAWLVILGALILVVGVFRRQRLKRTSLSILWIVAVAVAIGFLMGTLVAFLSGDHWNTPIFIRAISG